MAFDFGSLEPRIHQILSAPGTDLATISAKRVRRQLLDMDPSLTAEFLRENKEEVDAVIATVFEKVSGGVGVEAASDGMEPAVEETKPKSRKRKQEDDGEVPEDGDEDTTIQPSPPPKKPKKSSKNGRELSDAELARKLSSEINGRSTRTGAKGRGSSSAGKKGSRAKKSAATVDSDDDSEDGTRKRTRKKSATGTGAKGGFGKEFALSEPLAALIQVDKLSRPQVVKQLWVYIKGNELQNPENKREILCDGQMRAVFGVDKIDMFKMNKVLGQHLHEIE
ncbi:hypothetical protein GALMADRAFT_248365 [Galerina marginata CBS 339.88]|uniref:DM2 domain-containing protein n=1 Tax=Galerina marginata (strain CBS 339.88) TaxID=685588 RepID=A0A067T709_GALM3|nr:hypothetical protein GALMADRAFT_248365 [Galerina marginata CBS 339.88]